MKILFIKRQKDIDNDTLCELFSNNTSLSIKAKGLYSYTYIWIEEHKKIIASMSLRLESTLKIVYLEHAYVNQENRNKGLYKDILNTAIKYIYSNYYKWTAVLFSPPLTLDYYKKCGFEVSQDGNINNENCKKIMIKNQIILLNNESFIRMERIINNPFF